MRARTIREGSVGLLILAGVALFGGLVMWLRGAAFGQRSYRLLVDFESATGVQEGSVVSYRGVPVGQIRRISPGSNTVEVQVEINRGDLLIPAQSVVKTSQSGLIGETTVAIQPLIETSLSDDSIPGPLAKDCDSTLILCNGDQVNGIVGVNYEDLLESSQQISAALSEALADPATLQDIREILANTRDISGNVVGLTDEVTLMAKDLRTEIRPLSTSARQTLVAVSGAAQQLEASTVRTSEQLDTTLTQVNTILATNQDDLTVTLDNISASTGQLRLALDTLAPVIEEGTLVNNIELLANNAAIASQDLRDISSSLNTSENLVLLQQTIESARDVFQSAQKIMADVDTLTGDPTLRDDVRELLNSLSDLVSFTGDLENQTEVVEQLNEQKQIVRALEEEPSLRFNGERYVTDLANRPTPVAEPEEPVFPSDVPVDD
ncbi:MCE family protein [Leptolyngbya cf. ectocarpi LEGE 11479]|uniref:MCE family protein n=1 Tax=Leptolyngbya cf. ectocarpi LEGE 11479 TaxID=1828722 RepID=A0A929A0X6_LEPEC|nr:MlaD family protein [Leptolyngbya ectocarpi]MBE9070968.1 MCE family protein [Leptolyngbya cf. ectocarpi LEGE 11479]